MSGLMSIGTTAMAASYAALQTASNNISNANTPGYSRQTVQVADAPSHYTGGGYVGSGVDVKTVVRSYDKFLDTQALATGSTSAADAARLDKLTQLEALFPIGDAGIGNAAGQLLNSFVDVSNNPSDSSARQVVLSQAQELASRFAAAGSQLTDLQSGLSQDVATGVQTVNAQARQVADLNQQIASLKGLGQPPNQLLDQRDALIKEIGKSINVTALTADDGSIGLFVGGGQSLVLGANASTLKAISDEFDASHVQLAMSEGGTSRVIPPASLSGGSLAGLMKFQNEDLNTAQNLLGQMATAISGAVNAQQALGLDLGQPASAGAPMFSVGDARVLPAASNTGNADVRISVATASQVRASDYTLTFDGTAYALTRNADHATVAGSPFSAADLAAGVQVDGLNIQSTGGSPSAGDRFLLQPVTEAAQNMTRVLANTDGIAAASPFSGSTAVTNKGTATISALTAVDPNYNGSLSTTIQFTSSSGDYAWTMSDGSTGTGTWAAGVPIALNGYALSLDGVPKSGDMVQVQPTVSVSSDNGNALGFVRIGDQAIVGVSSTSPGTTVTDAYAAALADVGVRVQAGKTAASISSAAATQATAAQVNSAGVNLDEEAARLIQYQQSYQAAAKILQVAQSIFQTLLQTAGGGG